MRMKNIATVCLVAVVWLGLAVWCILGEKAEYSDSERRALAKPPEISVESILSGDFAADLEAYAVDTFPARDTWRSIKAYTRLGLFRQLDNNGIYRQDGHLAALEDPVNTAMADHVIERLRHIREKYLTDEPVYFAMIPDKNRYLADMKLDHTALAAYMEQGLDFAVPIRLEDMLTAEDYYRTDTHWRQECITDVAGSIAAAMGVSLPGEYEEITLDTPFYGVYVGQSALKCTPDSITYLTNPVIAGLQVEGAAAVYDLGRAEGRDPYEMFLSGNQPIVTIRNPQNDTGRRLIIFRDSFGSSIAPLLAQGYAETVLVDLRYISGDMLGEFVDMTGADVLILYSTLLLNNSAALK